MEEIHQAYIRNPGGGPYDTMDARLWFHGECGGSTPEAAGFTYLASGHIRIHHGATSANHFAAAFAIGILDLPCAAVPYTQLFAANFTLHLLMPAPCCRQ